MAWYLAVEGGGTRTIAGLYEEGRLIKEGVAGPSNPMAYGVSATAGVIVELATQLVPESVGQYTLLAGISGVMSSDIAQEIAIQLTALPGLDSTRISTDLHPLLYAQVPDRAGILVIAGTGASILVHDGQQHFRRFGGRGPVMGDDGSAYQIAVAALRAVARSQDGAAPETTLAAILPETLGLPDAESLVAWSLRATKQAVAALTTTVASVAERGDAVAQACIEAQADRLVTLTQSACATVPGDYDVPLYLQGGVIEHCPLFRERYLAGIASTSRLRVVPLESRGHEAVLSLRSVEIGTGWCFSHRPTQDSLSPTEGQHEDVPDLDTLEVADLVNVMIRHEGQVGRALQQQAGALAALTDRAGQALRDGGRIIYLGAGTSGRLGVLDASECPPTFGTRPEQVIGFIAGGDGALRNSAEGAEDDRDQGVADLGAFHPTSLDVVIGIAASGTTPYVLAALDAAQAAGAATALVCCNPLVRGVRVDHVVALPTGAEALPGSTRLNAGTATKVALNIISTGAMARSGYIFKGHMVKMRPSNVKLRARARRMLGTIAGIDEEECARLLEAAAYEIPIALIMADRGVGVAEARQQYDQARGDLRAVLGKDV